jgi:hypothetical protein
MVKHETIEIIYYLPFHALRALQLAIPRPAGFVSKLARASKATPQIKKTLRAIPQSGRPIKCCTTPAHKLETRGKKP